MTSHRPIVLIHGLFMSPHSWQGWIDRYAALGHEVHAPAWPGVSALTEERDPNQAKPDIGVLEIVDHYDAFIRALPDVPILMGHSIGGLVTQMLLDRGLGHAGVAIHPAPPRGVLRLPLSALRAGWPVLSHPSSRHRAIMLTDKQFHYAFANSVGLDRAAQARRQHAVASSGRPMFQAGLANLTPRAETKVNWRNNDRPPLLIMAGSADHIVPASVNRENYRRYRSGAVTEYREYPDRDHFSYVLPGWEKIADDALAWATAR